MAGLIRRFRLDRAGTAALEFAIAGPVVLLALIGCLEFGRYYWVRNTLEHAIEEAARYVILNKNASDADIQAQVRSKVSGIDPEKITVAVTPVPGSNVTFKTITATVDNADSSLSMITGFLPVKSLKLTAQTRIPVPTN
jgi:Flp pilus assembly protein TadG